MKIIISSFGYKFGTPNDTDLLLDARSLRNPFNNKALRSRTGLDDKVYFFVTGDPRWKKWKADAEWSAAYMVKGAELVGKTEVLIGIGCTGGRHRSVVATLELARFFHWNEKGLSLFQPPGARKVMVGHRDMKKEGEVMGELRNIKDILASLPHMSKKKVPWG